MIPPTPEADVLRAKLDRLSSNLWWAWNPEVVQIFRAIDAGRWRKSHHNPVAFLRELDDETLLDRAHEFGLEARIEGAFRAMEAYVEDTHTWAIGHAGSLLARPVVYFSAEFGIHESLPLYSGGLGVLAGDHIKSASDLGLPLVGVSLLYRGGYFQQWIDGEGRQQETYPEMDTGDHAIEEVRDPDGQPVVVDVEVALDEVIRARVWRVAVGRAQLLLLDPNHPDNSEENRQIAVRLYDAHPTIRIKQELLLGVGGLRAVRAVGVKPGVLHVNEGHAAFALLESIRYRMQWTGKGFDEARRDVVAATVFTTHTPVEAGHDRFDPGLVEHHLAPLRDALGLDHGGLMSLGRVDPGNDGEPFCMTVLGLKCSFRANGVSAIHGRVSRRMWRGLWPDRAETEVPIGHITNGVHVPSWLAPEMRMLYDRHLEPGWDRRMAHPETWYTVDRIPDDELWEVQRILKAKLVRFLRRTLLDDSLCQLPREDRNRVCQRFEAGALTIGFARRFAPYKRAVLLFSDLDRLRRLLTDPERPVQIVFAGKAHPSDGPGKEIVRRVNEAMCDPAFEGRIAFLPNYDISVGRHLVQGVNLWLNLPQRPLEASGTSGQKVVLNGGLNCSVLDGWYPEGFDGLNGFALGHQPASLDPGELERRDAEELYQLLEREVVPEYYDRGSPNLPPAWIRRIKRSIRTLGWRFSTDRMVMDYVLRAYLPAGAGDSAHFR